MFYSLFKQFSFINILIKYIPLHKIIFKMATGIGNRKVLTPRSSHAPRRSLPPQAKLVEATSFDSFDSQPSSPDIMTTKLLEKAKKNNSNKTGSINTSNNSLNQRLNAASNSLAASSGRSKLSTEEFKIDEDGNENFSEKYKRNGNDTSKPKENLRAESYGNRTVDSRTVDTGCGTRPTTGYTSGYNTSTNINKNITNATTSTGYSNANNSNSYNASNTSYNSDRSASSYQKPPYTSTITSRPDYANTSIPNVNNSYSYQSNTSFERFNSGESVELLQEQVSHLRREYEGLKQRFNELSRLRLSEPEEFLEEHKKLSEARDLAAEKTIKALQKENETLKKQLEESRKQAKKEDVLIEKADISDNDKCDEDFMPEIEKILKIYSSFSGLKITPTPSNPLTQWHCEFSSRSGHFDFQLTFDSNLNKYQYVPVESSKTSQLPAFLTSDILITPDQMQLFFWRLLDTLSKQKN